MTDEIWKPVITKGKLIPGYLISNHGRVHSTKTGKYRKIRNRICEGGRGNASTVTLMVPKSITNFEYYSPTRNAYTVTYQVHQLVAEAFMPIDLNPPDLLKDDWHKAPESFKQWVRDTVYIDHIDDNPFNNHINNLRYVTPMQNNSHRKKVEFLK